MRVLVTGNKGFIGNHLVNKLYGLGYDVITFSKNNQDILDPQHFSRLPKVDCVFHLAGLIYDKSDAKILSTNVIGTLNALDFALKNHAKFIFASSYLYGTTKAQPTDEKNPLNPENIYGVSKLAAENLCRIYSNSIPVVILRIFNAYGPGESTDFIIPKMVKELKSKGTITLSAPSMVRDFVYVSDIVEALILASKKKNTGLEIYNIGLGESWSMKQVAQKLIRISGKNGKIEINKNDVKNPVSSTLADIRKAKRKLGWTPKVGIDEGLKSTFNSY